MVLSYYEKTLNDRSRMERMEDSFKGQRRHDVENLDVAEGCRTESGDRSMKTRIEMVVEHDTGEFTERLNERLEIIETEIPRGIIRDIKFSICQDDFCAMIIYDEEA
jgi:hypothetical protein